MRMHSNKADLRKRKRATPAERQQMQFMQDRKAFYKFRRKAQTEFAAHGNTPYFQFLQGCMNDCRR